MRPAATAGTAAVVLAVVIACSPPAVARERVAGWEDVSAALDVLAARADAATASPFAPVDPGDRSTPAPSPERVSELLSRLDGSVDDTAAAKVWRGLFGHGAAALTPGTDGAPTVGARFTSPVEASRFMRRRLGHAREIVRRRKGSTPESAALERRIRRATDDLASPRRTTLDHGTPARCGPVQVLAAGDTAALGGLCTDLDRYWSRAGAAVVRVEPRRTGPVPEAEQQATSAASAVERVASDVDTAASRPAEEEDPPVTLPAAGPTAPVAAPREDRIAPVLSAARRPRTWMPAAAGVAAIALGLTMLRRVREAWPAGAVR